MTTKPDPRTSLRRTRRLVIAVIVVVVFIVVDYFAIVALTKALTPAPWMSPPRPRTPVNTGLILAFVLAINAVIGGLFLLWRFLRRRKMPAAKLTDPENVIDCSEHFRNLTVYGDAPGLVKDPAADEPVRHAPQTWIPAPKARLAPALTPRTSPDIHLLVQWTCSKDPGMEDSNEDVAHFVADGNRAAVFDGATESFAARRWARLVASCWAADADDFIARAQAEYALGASDRALSWAQEEASQRGSFTTIAAIQAAPGGLRTTIVGDSSVLFLNRDEITDSFPYATAEEFGSTPLALASDAASLRLCVDVLRSSTWLLPVDTSVVTEVLLVTDAVAAWLLIEDPVARTDRVHALRNIDTADQWRDLVHTERASRRMKTDDSTAILISIEGRS